MMNTHKPNPETCPNSRFLLQTRLIEKAMDGDAGSIQNLMSYLNSSNPDLRKMIQGALHETHDERVWEKLLHCISYDCWQIKKVNSGHEVEARYPIQAGTSIPQSIVEAFVVDESEAEKIIKLRVLQAGLIDLDGPVYKMAAYMLGLRGDMISLPVLEEMVMTRNPRWQLLAIQALSALNDPRCGPALVAALESDQLPVHQAAARAISEIGPNAEPALHVALQHASSHVRWHAARALGTIGNLRAVDMLAEGLLDSNQEVRWATARILAQIDAPAIPSILRLIIDNPMDEQNRQVIYHALHSMPSQQILEYLKPLLDVLHNPSKIAEAQPAARRLLADWNQVTPVKVRPENSARHTEYSSSA